MSEEYNEMELMTVIASRELEDKKIIYVGTKKCFHRNEKTLSLVFF